MKGEPIFVLALTKGGQALTAETAVKRSTEDGKLCDGAEQSLSRVSNGQCTHCMRIAEVNAVRSLS